MKQPLPLGATIGHYQLLERAGKTEHGHSARFKVRCVHCGYEHIRNPNKFTLLHRHCPTALVGKHRTAYAYDLRVRFPQGRQKIKEKDKRTQKWRIGT